MSDAVRVAAHAKVNLFLRILSREASGYHGLETVFGLLELADELTVERTASGVTIEVDGADCGPADDNLAVRGASAVLEATGNRFGVKIALTKHIPVRAGLGGGSSDAAAAMHAVNALANHSVPRHELLQMASRIGADVPFFVSGAPMALAWNHGERLYRLNSPGAAPVLVVKPAVHVSTPDAYAWFDTATQDSYPRGTVLFEDDAFDSWGSIGRLGGNDFESVVFHRHPELRELFERLAETHPLLVRMSGSGSALFAVYRNESARADAEMIMAGGERTLIPTAMRAFAAPGPDAG